MDPKNLHSLPAERAVLGCMLSYPAETVDEVRIVLGEDGKAFFDLAYREIYCVMLDLHDNGSGIDLLLVSESLKVHKELKHLDTMALLSELVTGYSDRGNVMSYVMILHEKKMLRDLVEMATETMQDAGEKSVAELLDKAASKLSEVEEIASPSDKSFGQSITQTAIEIVHHSKEGGGLIGLPTGFRRIDEVTGGFKNGQLIVIGARPGVGKCQAPETPVIMFDGSIKRADEVVQGDLLMGPDSKPRRVLSLASGREEMFEIAPIKGPKVRVNRSHILSLKMSTKAGGYEKGEIVNLSLDEFFQKTAKFKAKAKLHRVGIELPEVSVKIDPYWVGLWLGDGSVGKTEITKDEPELDEFFQTIPQAKKRYHAGRCASHTFTNKRSGGRVKNKFLDLARECFVEKEKRIPKRYLLNSRENRLRLLAGLLDTDGFLENNCYEIITKYTGLAGDILFLARSLGFAATEKQKLGTIKSRGFAAWYTRIVISGNIVEIPCRIKRKKGCARRQIKSHLVTGFSVRSVGIGEYVGWELEGDGLYLWGDFTVTHNTALSISFARSFLRNKWSPDTRDFTDPGFPGGMFSLEMSREELDARLLSGHAAMAMSSFHKGDLGENEQAKLLAVAESIKHWPFYIDTQKDIDITQIRARARRWKRKYGIQWLIVDFLQLVQNRAEKKQGRTEAVSGIARNLKWMAGELDIPIIALAQLNRSVEEEEPKLHHLKESGAIEESADLVFLLHELKAEEQHEGKVKKHLLNLAKQRNGPSNIKMRIEYRAWCTLFVDMKENA